jgi:protein-S-isoprenylcysteine O-methyltransferase Ste14
MDPIGKSPIPVPMLILGKAAMAVCLLFFALKTQIAGSLLYDSALTRTLGVLLAAGGLLLVVLGFVFLGRSVSVGLPGEETELKTQGIFKFTRNPLYLGGFLACVGSCLYSFHIVNILLCALAVGIHHSIILKEEEFLEERFGQRWLDYSRRVPRYLGKPST